MKSINNLLNLSIVIKIVLIFIMVVAIFDLPYDYYEIIRYAGMVLFSILGYVEYEKKNKVLMIIWFAYALLINPFAKLNLEKEIWTVIDTILVVSLILSYIKEKSISNFNKLNLKIKLRYIISIILWCSVGTMTAILLMPKTIEYYMSKGYTKSYSKEIIESKNETILLTILILIITIGGAILILNLLNKTMEKPKNDYSRNV